MLTNFFVRALATLLDNASLLVASNKFDTATAFEFQSTLLLIVESMANTPKILINLHDSIITYLLPVLMSKVLQVDDLL